MEQQQVFIHLMKKRLKGDNNYYTIREINQELEGNITACSRIIRQLYAYGYLGINNKLWRFGYRAKKDLCIKNIGIVSPLNKDIDLKRFKKLCEDD